MSDDEFLLEQKNQKNIFGISEQEIDSIKSKLPDKRYYEFLNHCYFEDIHDLREKWKTWYDWKVWDYPIQDLVKFDNIIIKNKDFFVNKSCVHVACNIGYISLFLLHAGAKDVVTVDSNQDKLDLMLSINDIAGFTNHSVKVEDFNNTSEFKSICDSHDVLVLVGKVYNPVSFYGILGLLKDTNLTTAIIDTTLNLESAAVSDVPIRTLIEAKLKWKLMHTNQYKTNESNGLVDRYVYCFIK